MKSVRSTAGFQPAPAPGRLEAGGTRLAHAVIAFVALFLTQPLFACPVCFGSPDDPMVKGTANGVWVLIGIIAFVQLGLVAMFFSFWWRARQQKRFREQFHLIDGGQHS